MDREAAVVAFLDGDGWNPEPVSAGVVEVGFQGDSGRWACFVVLPDDTHVVFYSVVPGGIGIGARAQVLQYLSRVNFGLVHGSFEMDLDDGETRLRTSLTLGEDELPTDAQLRDLAYSNVLTMDEHLATIRAVEEGRETPTAAYARMVDR